MNAPLTQQAPVLEHEQLLDADDEETTVKTARPSWAVEADSKGTAE